MNTDLYIQRPDNQKKSFTLQPSYEAHKAYDDKLAILVCQIKIWEPKGSDWFDIPKAGQCLTIRECESIEITDSAKELVGKAVVGFPRGTVISLSSKQNGKVSSGNAGDSTESTSALQDSSNGGEFITPRNATYSEDGVSVMSMAANYDDKGLIDFNRSKTETALLSPNDVAIGNRIEIRLGYAYSETEFKEMNTADSHQNMVVAFTGFITSISVDTPLQLECKNMAHVLSCISTPNIPAIASIKVSEFLDDDGRYHLLKDTGIELVETSKKSQIAVSGDSISDNLTVTDVLSKWEKFGVFCIMETDSSSGISKLRVGKVFYAGTNKNSLPNNEKNYMTYNGGDNTVTFIQFDWDVAEDRLSLKSAAKKFLAIEAQGQYEPNQFFKLTIRLDPNGDDEGWLSDGGGEFQTVNSRKPVARKKTKIIDGTRSTKKLDKMKDKVDLDKYTVIPYISETVPITEKELIEEAKQYWAMSTNNGISGTISIFGDKFVKPTDIVGLIDMRQPEKNGYYYVESVNTTFGINGYRRELKIPYKMAAFSAPVKII